LIFILRPNIGGIAALQHRVEIVMNPIAIVILKTRGDFLCQ
jgi:hypothetical protein